MTRNEDDRHDNTVNRRKILKATGAGVTAPIVSIPAMGNVRARSQSNSYVGQTYDSLSHKAQGRVDATLTKSSDNRLSGELEAAGFSISLGQNGGIVPEPGVGETAVYYGQSRKESHLGSGLPLVYKLIDYGLFLTGHISRPSPEFGKLGITMNSVETEVTAEDIRRSLVGGGEGRQGYKDARIPETGIPRTIVPEDSK